MSEMAEPDRIDGAPHPRETLQIFGHESAGAALESALLSGRMAHAWLLAGPQGIGKASFAYRASAALLSGRRELGHDAADPVHRAITGGAEMRLRCLTRTPNEKTGKLRGQIAVDDVRAVKASLGLSAPDGGWRAVIVDAAEEMNISAANALLKVLEEPPARVVFFLVSHAPGRLLPTIRSRCRRLDFQPLSDDALSLAYEAATGEPPASAVIAAARGSVGMALALAAHDGAVLQEGIAKVLAPLPIRIDRAALHVLADNAAASGKDEAFRTAVRLLSDLTARMATRAAGADAAPSELPLAPPVSSASAWAEAALDMAATAERTLALNLDRRQALLDMVSRIERVARSANA